MEQEGHADAGWGPLGPGISSASDGERGCMGSLGERGGLSLEETMDSGSELESGAMLGSEVS